MDPPRPGHQHRLRELQPRRGAGNSGRDGVQNGETPWTADGDAIVLAQWSGSPRFTQDPSTQGALVANPGMYGAGG